MKRFIHAAEDSAPTIEEKLTSMLSLLKDNFNFATDGIEKIAADGNMSEALAKATALNEMIDGVIGEIAEDIAE